MKSFLMTAAACAVLITSSCISDNKKMHASTSDTGHLAAGSGKATAAATTTINGLDTLKTNNRIALTANDRMQFSDTLFKVKAAQPVTVKLTNIGKMPKESMGHTFTVLAKGADFTAYVTKALHASSTGYQPADMKSSVIAHTKLVGPGESDQITFKLPSKGVFDFLCTFPNHYGSMRGKIVAE